MESYDIRTDFLNIGTRKEVKRGEYICNPLIDGITQTVCYLEQGVASLITYNDAGEERVHLYFNAKRVIGFAGVLVRMFADDWKKNYDWGYVMAPQMCWAIAKTDCPFYHITEQQFLLLMSESPDFCKGILNSMTHNYLELINKFHITMDGNRTAQFCQWLLSCSIKKGEGYIVPKTFSFAEVSKYLGMHPVTVSRLAKKLKEMGAIDRKDSCIIIKDKDLLISLMHHQDLM